MGLAVIDKNKNFRAHVRPVVRLLHADRSGRRKRSEFCKRKVENNPQQANYLVQLAAHYLLTKQQRSSGWRDAAAVGRETSFRKAICWRAISCFSGLAISIGHARSTRRGQKAFPKDKVVYQKRLVELLATTGRNQDANQLLATILKETPKDSDAVAMRAALMLVTGDLKQINQAVNDLQSLVAKTPDNHLLRYNLARAYWPRTIWNRRACNWRPRSRSVRISYWPAICWREFT